MPIPILKKPQSHIQEENRLSINYQQHKQPLQQIDKMKLNRLLRKTRSKEYMAAIHRLDAGGHTHNQHKVNEVIDAIHNEFPEVKIRGILLGIVSICYLGRPYEVHTLDMTGQIIEHYKGGQTLPGSLEKARSIALRGGYDFIEVYVDCFRCISYNGYVSVVSY